MAGQDRMTLDEVVTQVARLDIRASAQRLLTRQPGWRIHRYRGRSAPYSVARGIPVSSLATYLGKIDRAYVRFAAVEEISAYALELGGGRVAVETLGPEAEDIAYSARRARRLVAVEDRLKLLAVRLTSPGEFEIAAGAANTGKATAGALEKVVTLKQTVRQAEAETRLKRASADDAEIEVDLKSATADAELRARLAEAEQREAVARADIEEARARRRFASDREALDVRREAMEVAKKELEMYREIERAFPDSEAVEALRRAVADSVAELMSPTVVRLTDGAKVEPLERQD